MQSTLKNHQPWPEKNPRDFQKRKGKQRCLGSTRNCLQLMESTTSKNTIPTEAKNRRISKKWKESPKRTLILRGLSVSSTCVPSSSYSTCWSKIHSLSIKSLQLLYSIPPPPSKIRETSKPSWSLLYFCFPIWSEFLLVLYLVCFSFCFFFCFFQDRTRISSNSSWIDLLILFKRFWFW